MGPLLARCRCPTCGTTFECHITVHYAKDATCPTCFKRIGQLVSIQNYGVYLLLAAELHRWDVVNYAAGLTNAQTYLEIGLGNLEDDGRSFGRIEVPHKESVDPNEEDATHQVTSDEFFEANDRKFDLVFVDGWHSSEQVERDLEGALGVGAKVVVVHDMNPATEEMQLNPPLEGVLAWNGDGWKVWARMRATRPDLWMGVADLNYGCGVVIPGEQECIEVPDQLDWDYLVENRRELLNLLPWPVCMSEMRRCLA